MKSGVNFELLSSPSIRKRRSNSSLIAQPDLRPALTGQSEGLEGLAGLSEWTKTWATLLWDVRHLRHLHHNRRQRAHPPGLELLRLVRLPDGHAVVLVHRARRRLCGPGHDHGGQKTCLSMMLGAIVGEQGPCPPAPPVLCASSSHAGLALCCSPCCLVLFPVLLLWSYDDSGLKVPSAELLAFARRQCC